MKKQEFIDAVASKSGLTKKDSGLALKAILETITDTLKAKDSVSFVGFGSFSTVERAARDGRNPTTGEAIKIPARTAVKFKAGKTLKEVIA